MSSRHVQDGYIPGGPVALGCCAVLIGCLSLAGCASLAYQPLSNRDASTLKKIMLIMVEDGPHDRAIYVNSADGTVRMVRDGDMVRYEAQLEFVRKNLDDLIPQNQRCPKNKAGYFGYLIVRNNEPSMVYNVNSYKVFTREAECTLVADIAGACSRR